MRNSKKSNVTQKFIEIIEKLQSIGVDIKNLVSTDTIESLAEKSGIDKEQIKKAGLDPNYRIGQKRFLIAQACKGKGKYTKPNEKQVKKLEQLGILRKDNSLTKKSKVIDKFIEIIEKLQNIGVDTNKLVSTDTIESLAKKSGIDEEKIKEVGLDLNYKVGQIKVSIAQAYRGKGTYTKPTEEQVNELKELGISLEKRDVVEEFINIIKKLQNIGVDTNKLVQVDTIESLAEKSGIDKEKIKKAGLDPNYKIGQRKKSIAQAYRGQVNCIPPTEEQVNELKELGISLEKRDVVEEFIEIIEKMQSIGVVTYYIKVKDTVRSLAKKSEIDEEKIKEAGLDPNYKIGKRKNSIAQVYRGKKDGTKPTEEQVKQLKKLGISLEKVTKKELKLIVVEQKNAGEIEKNHEIEEDYKSPIKKSKVTQKFIEIIEKLQSIGVDTNKLVQTDTIGSLAEKSGIDKEQIKKAGLDPNYEIGKKRFSIAQAYRGKGTYAKPTEEQVNELKELGILLEKRDVVEEFIEIIEKMQSIGVVTYHIKVKDTVRSLAKKSGIDEEKIKEAGLDPNYKIGQRKNSIAQAYRGQANCIPPTEEQVDWLKKLGILLEKRDVVEEFINIIKKLQNIGVDTNKLVQVDTIESLAKKSGIDKEQIKKAGLDPNYKIGQRKNSIAQAYRGTGRCIPPTEEQVNKLKELGIFLEKVTREELKSIVVEQKNAEEIGNNSRIDKNYLEDFAHVEGKIKKEGKDRNE